MKISTEILKKLNACQSGFSDFESAHGDNEIMFSDCVKSGSNSIQDYFWFIRRQPLNDDHKKDLQLLAIEYAERVLPIFEAKYPEDNRPRAAIETAKLYIYGEATLDALKEASRSAVAAAYADAATDYTAYAADAAYAAAYAAVAAVDAAVDAAAVANAAAVAAVADASERSWQKQRLAKLMIKWGW